MGDPKKQRKKYSGPSHPWQKQRIEEERELTRKYGLKNKKEIWKANSLLRTWKKNAKLMIASKSKQAELEKNQLLSKLRSLGLLDLNSQLDSVLGLTLGSILNRRLQTVVYDKLSTRTINQARQFIIHEHIFVGDKKVTVPSYLVSKEDEASISFSSTSPLSDLEHPERVQVKAKAQETKEKPEVKQEAKKEVAEVKTDANKDEAKENKNKKEKSEETKPRKTKAGKK